jgi:hypothetical protein
MTIPQSESPQSESLQSESSQSKSLQSEGSGGSAAVAVQSFPSSLAILPGYDPKGRLRAVLFDGQACSLKPQDVLLAWLLELPGQLDPARAAGALLVCWRAANRPILVGRGSQELLDMIEQVARFPREKMRAVEAFRRDRRRRRLGGRPPWVDLPGTNVRVRGVACL